MLNGGYMAATQTPRVKTGLVHYLDVRRAESVSASLRVPAELAFLIPCLAGREPCTAQNRYDSLVIPQDVITDTI